MKRSPRKIGVADAEAMAAETAGAVTAADAADTENQAGNAKKINVRTDVENGIRSFLRQSNRRAYHMNQQKLSMARRHVLGDLYGRCEPVTEVPVYLNDGEGDVLGHVDESLGKYADAMTFHLDDQTCKRLASGHFSFSFEFKFAGDDDSELPSAKRRIKLSSVFLIMRKGYEKPVPKSKQTATVSA